MQTEAERLAELNEDIERIAKALCPSWTTYNESLRDWHRSKVRRLLAEDVIRVGRRPDTGPVPLDGQEALELHA